MAHQLSAFAVDAHLNDLSQQESSADMAAARAKAIANFMSEQRARLKQEAEQARAAVKARLEATTSGPARSSSVLGAAAASRYVNASLAGPALDNAFLTAIDCASSMPWHARQHPPFVPIGGGSGGEQGGSEGSAPQPAPVSSQQRTGALPPLASADMRVEFVPGQGLRWRGTRPAVYNRPRTAGTESAPTLHGGGAQHATSPRARRSASSSALGALSHGTSRRGQLIQIDPYLESGSKQSTKGERPRSSAPTPAAGGAHRGGRSAASGSAAAASGPSAASGASAAASSTAESAAPRSLQRSPQRQQSAGRMSGSPTPPRRLRRETNSTSDGMMRQALLSASTLNLKASAPSWWKVPAKVETCAKAFEWRHNKRVYRAERFSRSVSHSPSLLTQYGLLDSIHSVNTNRARHAPLAYAPPPFHSIKDRMHACTCAYSQGTSMAHARTHSHRGLRRRQCALYGLCTRLYALWSVRSAVRSA